MMVEIKDSHSFNCFAFGFTLNEHGWVSTYCVMSHLFSSKITCFYNIKPKVALST